MPSAQSHRCNAQKKTTGCKEQDPAKVSAYRQQLEQLSGLPKVYLDETGFDTFYYRPYAYVPKGVSVKERVSGRRYQRLSLVAAQTDEGLIAPMTCENTMDSALFEAWFEHFLLSALKQPSVIIMDNARFHRMTVLRGMARKEKDMILPLPPYLPELNPIEEVWANVKRALRKTALEHAC